MRVIDFPGLADWRRSFHAALRRRELCHVHDHEEIPAGFGPPRPRGAFKKPPLAPKRRSLAHEMDASGMSMPDLQETSVPETIVEDPSLRDDETPSQLRERCLCGKDCLTMKRGPHFLPDEYARLAEVIMLSELRSAIGVLTQGPDRLGLEDGGQDGFSKLVSDALRANKIILIGDLEGLFTS